MQTKKIPYGKTCSEKDVAQPDILFITKERLKIIKEKNIKGAPDLIIEILSTKTKKMDTIIKRKLYAKHKVPEYWIVDIDKKQIEVLVLGEKDYNLLKIYKEGQILKSKVIKEMKIKVEEVFRK